MKTKTLLIAAAALAAGVISSQAQVYSQNIVGYVNVVVPANTYVLAATPLTTGNDVLSNVLNSATGVPAAGTTVYAWNAAGQKYRVLSYNGSHWTQGAANQDNLALGPGSGYFFYNASTAFTNTYVGAVNCPVGGGVTNALAASYGLVGSQIPYGDSITNASTINLQAGIGSTLNIWNVSKQKYNVYSWNSGANSWQLGANLTNPIINVAQGFFYNGLATNWVQSLPGN